MIFRTIDKCNRFNRSKRFRRIWFSMDMVMVMLNNIKILRNKELEKIRGCKNYSKNKESFNINIKMMMKRNPKMSHKTNKMMSF